MHLPAMLALRRPNHPRLRRKKNKGSNGGAVGCDLALVIVYQLGLLRTVCSRDKGFLGFAVFHAAGSRRLPVGETFTALCDRTGVAFTIQSERANSHPSRTAILPTGHILIRRFKKRFNI